MHLRWRAFGLAGAVCACALAAPSVRAWGGGPTPVAANAAARPTPPAGTQAAYDLTLAQGLEALEAGRYAEALGPLRQCLDAVGEPNARLELRFWTAEAALHAQAPELALALLGPLVTKLAPIGDEIQARRARALMALGRPAEAAAAWQSVGQDWPRGPTARRAAFGLGHALLASHYAEAGLQALRRALARYPRAPEAPAARLTLADAVAAQRGSAWALPSWRALTTSLDAQVAEAAKARLRQLDKLGLLPAPAAHERLAEIDGALAARRLEEAEAALTLGLAEAATTSAEPQLARARLQLRQAQLLRRRRAPEAARALLENLAERGPAPVRRAALREWAGLALAGSTPADAAPLYARLAREGDRSTRREASFAGAIAHYAAGADAQAEQAFARYATSYPRDGRADEARWFAAWAAYRRGAWQRADAHLTQLLARWPHGSLRGRAHYWRARLAERRGARAQATAGYRAALRDETGYYAVLARQRLAAVPEPRPSAPAAPPPTALALLGSHHDPAEAAKTTTALAAPALPAACDAVAQAAADGAGEAPGAAPTFDDALAWQAPMGWRTAWLFRLGLLQAAAQTAAAMPTGAHVSHATAQLARAQLLLALGDYHGAMVAGSALLGRAQGWPQAGAAGDQCVGLPLAYPHAYAPLVAEAAREFAVAPTLVWAIMRQESAFVPAAESSSFAHGLMQIMPQTGSAIARRLKEPYDTEAQLLEPRRNVRYGAWYLARLLENYGGNVALAVGAYNAGPAAMDGWLSRFGPQPLDEFVENVPFRETRQYIKHVLVNLNAYGQLGGEAPLTLMAQASPGGVRAVDF